MAKQNRSVNGGVIPAHTGNLNVLAVAREYEPVIPVKTEQQLLLEAEIERLKAENTSLKARPVSSLSLKISEKGALSVYGMGRFPVTLYREQWERLLGMADQIRAFIHANSSRLKVKGQE